MFGGELVDFDAHGDEFEAGDLFTSRVDKVWSPMESLYEPGKTAPARWDTPAPKAVVENKANELVLPTGHRP